MKPNLIRPLRVAGIYLMFSVAWILLSDSLLQALVSDPDLLTRLQTSKGLLFVLISALLILLLCRHEQRELQQLEQGLRQRLLQLQRAQRDAGLGIWRYDGQLHWSAEALHLLGRPDSDNTGSLDDLYAWLHPADRNTVQRAVRAMLEDGAALLVNARLNRPSDQAPVWLLLRGNPDGSGLAHGSVQNISGQKRDEQALRESEQRFRQLFEQTPRIAVQGYDRDRRVIFWNQASAQLYGYSVTEAMGRRLEDLIVPPPMRAQVVRAISAWMIGGPGIPASELTLRHRDGSEVHVYSSHLLLHNTRGQLEMYCVDIDLGQQHQTHRDLEHSEARYRDLVEQLHEAIFLVDAGGRLSFVNPAWESITGYSTQESLGRPLLDFIEDDFQEQVARQISAILARQASSWQGELRLRDASGHPHWVALHLGSGEYNQGLRGSLGDIQERRHSQALQEARNAMLDRMLAQRPLQETMGDMARRLEQIDPQMLVSILRLDGERLRLLAAPSLPGRYAERIDGGPARLGADSCGHAAASGELTVVADILAHPHWQELREDARQAGLRAGWALPFKNDQGQVLGVFGIYHRKVMRPSPDDLALVVEFTRLAGLAVSQQQRDAERLQSELRFRATFEQAAVGIAHLAPDGHWLRVNQRLCQMLGYNREELLGQTFQAVTHPDDLDKDLNLTNMLLTGEIQRLSLEKRYLRRDGSLLWANLSATLVRHTNGEPHYFISVVEDIGLRKQQEQALRQAATVFESTQEGVLVVDARRRIITCNPAFSSITGLSAQQLLGQRLPLLPGNELDRARYRTLWRKVQETGHWHGELNSRRPDGSHFPFWLTVSRVHDCDPQQPQYVMTFTDLSQYRDSQERLAHLVHFDTLTDLPNRLFALERLGHALEHAHRHNERVAVLYFDLDNFKTINESLGHKVGDELLVAVARRLQKRLRNEDTLARLSSDEFLVVLENLQRPEEAANTARSLIELLERPLPLDKGGREAYLSASIGISLYPDDGLSSDDLLRNADSALHQAKQEGRNTYRFYTQGLTHQAHTRLSLEGRLRQALKRGELMLHYQPLVDARNGHPTGVEALLRWNSSEGMVSPAQFIPLAEETGLIVPIGSWVLREACRQMQFWRQQGLPLQTLAVNLSPRQFRQADLLTQVREALAESGLPAEHLELEITEGALIENVEQAQASLAALKALGLKLAIDDFGTGYSSLAYLRRFPLDKLKIDQSFMRGVPEDQANLEIVATIIGLARNLKLRVLAEGVENAEQLRALRQMGCEQCQGYLFSRPLSAVQLVHWLRSDHQSVG